MQKIKLYTTNCPKCKVLEAKLRQKNIDFDLITNFDTKELIDKGFLSAPILQVDDEYLDFSHAITFVNNF